MNLSLHSDVVVVHPHFVRRRSRKFTVFDVVVAVVVRKDAECLYSRLSYYNRVYFDSGAHVVRVATST